MRLVVLTKAKYKKRWKGSDGKWRYDYHDPKGRQAAIEEPVKSKHRKSSLGNPADIERSLKKLQRRPKGQGGPEAIDSIEVLDAVLLKTNVAFISAGRNPEIPEDVKLSDADIAKRDLQMKADLKEMGYVWTPALGKYGSLPEDSIIVMTHDADKNEMMDLGAKYNQDAVLFTDHGHNEMLNTTGANKGKAGAVGDGYELLPDANDFYTEIEIAGKPTRFSMALEWGKSVYGYFMRLLK